MEIKSKKVKCTFTVDSFDLHKFKEQTREERTTPSIVVGQMISNYLKERGEK